MLSSRWLHRKLVYPGIVTIRGERGVFKTLAWLKELEQQPPMSVETHVRNRLTDLLTYTRSRSEFYQRAWPRELQAGQDVLSYLTSLPLVSKAVLQRESSSMIVSAPSRVTIKTTGGSTGEAVTVVKDRAGVAHERAASWLGYGWFGVRPGDRAVRFWGSPFTWKRRLRFMAADFAMNRMRFSAFAFRDEDLDRYWRKCLRFRPDYFYGYVSMLTTFAEHINRHADGRRLGLKVIITTSEVLGEPQRRLLESTFGCPVQNEYGCGEVGPIAYGCDRGMLHIMSDNVYVEVLRSDGSTAPPGEMGELVVTDLNNRAMPLIRYRVGDFGIAGGLCSCGRPFPTLERVVGRAYDFVIAPDGRKFHGEYFMYLFEDLKRAGLGVDQFQVRQLDENRIEINLRSAKAPSTDQLNALHSRVLRDMPGVDLGVRSVEEIGRAKSGKTQVIVNEMLNKRS